MESSDFRPTNGGQTREPGGSYERRAVERRHTEPATRETRLEEAAGGSMTGAVAAAGTVVLAILALVGVIPMVLMPIAVIGAGVALAALGAGSAARFALLESAAHGRTGSVIGGGLTTETVGGVAVVVLGILSLIGLAPLSLSAIAVLVLGGSIMIGSGSTWELSELPRDDRLRAEHAAREAQKAAAGVDVLVGAGAIVLGILALIGLSPLTLVEVSLLAFGGAATLSGGAVSSRVGMLLRH